MQNVSVEYRVRPVTRYIVTRYESFEHGEGNIGGGGSVCGSGEFDNAETAYQVGYALARAEHERLGYDLGDARIKYPQHPDLSDCARNVSA